MKLAPYTGPGISRTSYKKKTHFTVENLRWLFSGSGLADCFGKRDEVKRRVFSVSDGAFNATVSSVGFYRRGFVFLAVLRTMPSSGYYPVDIRPWRFLITLPV